ncbi:MAG: hypothetical protein FWE62_03045 [Firmicutes bacterium]|nr:hypothetical protein [Bacillota bacterium]
MNNLEVFLESCDRLTASEYIQSTVKLKEFLSAAASCDDVMRLLSGCLKGFDFWPELRAAVYPVAPKRAGIRYPDEARKYTAFVFSLLYKLDTGEINLKDFLSAYYYDDTGIVKSYADFMAAVVPKFKRTLYAGLTGREPVSREDRFSSISEAEEITRTVAEAISYITAEPAVTLDEKEEMLVVLALLSELTESGTKRQIKAAYLGARNTCRALPSTAKYINHIFGCLKRGGVL